MCTRSAAVAEDDFVLAYGGGGMSIERAGRREEPEGVRSSSPIFDIFSMQSCCIVVCSFIGEVGVGKNEEEVRKEQGRERQKSDTLSTGMPPE